MDPIDRAEGRFSEWLALDDAGAAGRVSNRPGVIQVKTLRGLLDYPGGRSAMVLYAAVTDMRAWLASQRAGVIERLAARGVDGPLRFRVQAAADPSRLGAEVLGRFVQRFRARPLLNDEA